MIDQVQSCGEVITFYSYKGGVGRSMALANVVRCISNSAEKKSTRILAIDWDLDAPGLHRFFPSVKISEDEARPGLIDYFVTLRCFLESDKQFAAEILKDQRRLEALAKRVPLTEFIIRNAAPGIDLMPAGKLDKLMDFSWTEFYETYPSVIPLFRELITTEYRYCFVDSRTGYNDISGICTALMPEKLVALFVPNEQNLQGLLKMIEMAVEYRRNSNDSRPLSVFPLASRIDNSEQAEKDAWLLRFQHAFEKLFSRLYDVRCDLSAHFDKVQLPNISYYAYGEKVAMLEEDRSQLGSLRRAYETFADCLVSLAYPWAT